jgi:ATP-dependent phosphoenolpyruvate carboxykinase
MTANGPVKVRKTDSLRLLRAMQRGEIEWKLDKNLGLEVPAKVQGMSQAELDRITVGRGMQPAQYKRMLDQVRSERVAHLKANIPGLNPSIMDKGVY